MQHLSFKKSTLGRPSEQGNAIVIILILIILLAALTAVSMRSSSRSPNNADTETIRIAAEKLIRQAQGLETGVTKLKTQNQCSENDISFLNTTTTRDYTNASTPTDNHCKIFSVEGAGLTYSNPDTSILDTTFSADADYGQWVFTATHCVLGLGADDNDICDDPEVALMAIVPHVSLQTCIQINNLMGVTNPSGVPPEESLDETSATFTGDFDATSDPEIGEAPLGTDLVGHATGCLKNNSGAWANSYVFYHALSIR